MSTIGTEIGKGHGAALATYEPWTPEALKEKVEREKALRGVFVDYVKGQLKPGQHFYNLPGQEQRKPALAKEGALNICSLFEVIPQPEQPAETFAPDGHYTVRARVNLVSLRTGQIVATGDGSCSTRESKYAFRWVFESGLPAEVDKATLAGKKVKTRNGWATMYRLPNADLPDTWNTVLKMADKRATVAASLKLPLVSEVFTQDLEEQIAERAAGDDAPPAEAPASAPPAGTADETVGSPALETWSEWYSRMERETKERKIMLQAFRKKCLEIAKTTNPKDMRAEDRRLIGEWVLAQDPRSGGDGAE